MRPHLIPCTTCERHVHATELACPFCGTEREADAGPGPSNPLGRPSSLAIMTFRAAAVGAVLAACSGSTSNDDAADAGAAGDDSLPTSGGTGSGGVPNDTTPGRGGDGSGGSPVIGTGGIENMGGGVPIYRATPKG